MDIERLNQIGRNLESLEGRKKRKGVKTRKEISIKFQEYTAQSIGGEYRFY